MIWVILLVLLVAVGTFISARSSGFGYTAGRGMFRNSMDQDENKGDISDFDPYDPDEYNNIRK